MGVNHPTVFREDAWYWAGKENIQDAVVLSITDSQLYDPDTKFTSSVRAEISFQLLDFGIDHRH